jgi:hypothetical protein
MPYREMTNWNPSRVVIVSVFWDCANLPLSRAKAIRASRIWLNGSANSSPGRGCFPHREIRSDEADEAVFGTAASAFDQYCDVLLREEESRWARVVVDQLHAALGADACHLINLIPKSSLVLDNHTALGDFNLDQNYVHIKQRLHYLLCQFVKVISRNSCISVTLFMDDVQWADEASISVLNLLLRREHKNIFFLWSC